MAKTEGYSALRERLDMLLKQAEEASRRNKHGDISVGLRKGIRGTLYMLDRTVSNERRPAVVNGEDNVGGKGNGQISRRTGSTMPSPGNEPQRQSAEINGRICKFGEGVEMLTPTVCTSKYFFDELGARVKAYEIYSGRAVRRDKHGQAIVSNTISYTVIGNDPRFRDGYPHLSNFESHGDANSSCDDAVENEADMRERTIGFRCS